MRAGTCASELVRTDEQYARVSSATAPFPRDANIDDDNDNNNNNNNNNNNKHNKRRADFAKTPRSCTWRI